MSDPKADALQQAHEDAAAMLGELARNPDAMAALERLGLARDVRRVHTAWTTAGEAWLASLRAGTSFYQAV